MVQHLKDINKDSGFFFFHTTVLNMLAVDLSPPGHRMILTQSHLRKGKVKGGFPS